MSSLFFIVGLSLFLTGLSIYFRHALRNDRGMRLVALLIPPLTWVYFGGCRYSFRLAAYLQIAGIGMFIGGLLLWSSTDSQFRTTPDLVIHSSQDLRNTKASELSSPYKTRLQAARLEKSGALSGKLNGYPFNVQSAQYIDGVLALSQRGGYYSELEIRIYLEQGALPEWSELLFTPGDENAPVIHVSWVEPGQSVPQTKIYTQGYSLELQVEAVTDNLLHAQMELILPDARSAFLVGSFDAHLSHMRYTNGEVDRFWDSEQTLHYVIDKHLKNHYEFKGLQVTRYSEATFKNRYDPEPKARIIVTTANSENIKTALIFELEKAEEGWRVDTFRSDFSALEKYSQINSIARNRQRKKNTVRDAEDTTPNLAVVARSSANRPQERGLTRPAATQISKTNAANRAAQGISTQTAGVSSGTSTGVILDAGSSTNVVLDKGSSNTLAVNSQGPNTARQTGTSNGTESLAQGRTTVSLEQLQGQVNVNTRPNGERNAVVKTGIPGTTVASAINTNVAIPETTIPKTTGPETAGPNTITPKTITPKTTTLDRPALNTTFEASIETPTVPQTVEREAVPIDENSGAESIRSASNATPLSIPTSAGLLNAARRSAGRGKQGPPSTPEPRSPDVLASSEQQQTSIDDQRTPTVEAAAPQKQSFDSYLQKLVAVSAKDGRTVKGLFTGVRKQRLVIETRLGGGLVEYFVKLDQLESIRLLTATVTP